MWTNGHYFLINKVLISTAKYYLCVYWCHLISFLYTLTPCSLFLQANSENVPCNINVWRKLRSVQLEVSGSVRSVQFIRLLFMHNPRRKWQPPLKSKGSVNFFMIIMDSLVIINASLLIFVNKNPIFVNSNHCYLAKFDQVLSEFGSNSHFMFVTIQTREI